MRYEHEAEGEGGRLTGAASRFDRWGTRRGSPYSADPAWDEPPPAPAPGVLPWTGGAGGGFGGGDDSSSWVGGGAGSGGDAGDAYGWDDGWDAAYAMDPVPLYGGPWLPPRVWSRWRGRPWFPGLYGMLRGARPAGTLRHRRTGARYPVYRGRMGGRGWRVVTRPSGRGGGRGGGGRGGMRHEVIGLEAETGMGMEMEGEAFPLGGGAPSAAAPPPAPVNGPWRLRLPHAALHGILGRMAPGQLRTLGGGRIPADPSGVVVRRLGRAARRARRLGRFRTGRGGSPLDVFAAPGMRLLVRPVGEMEGEIVAVAPVEDEDETVYRDRQTGYRRTIAGKQYRVRGAIVQVNWSAAVPLSRVYTLKPPASAVYVLLKNGKPVYVGETASWGTRWRARLDTLSEFGVSPSPYTVAVGSITWKGPGSAPAADLLRNDTEAILIRGLSRAGLRMNNRTSDAMILAPRGETFRVENQNPPPGFPAGPMQPAGSDIPYELESA
jgi:hypothetical protein